MTARALTTLALFVLAAAACDPSRTGDTQPVAPELKLEGVRFRVWRGDDLRVVGEAAQVTLRRDTSELTARDLEAVLPRSAPIQLQAPEGSGVLGERVFEIRGGVTVTRGEDVARTERATYTASAPGAAVVRGDRPVEVEGPAYRLTGTGFTLDATSGDLSLAGPARLVAQPEARR